MRAIFVSYRREDTEGHAGRLFGDLTERFGKDVVFMDVAGIEPGRDFRRVIEQQVASCGVLLAVIGKSWLTAADEQGRRRLDDPIDFVRLETASALKRDIPVIPVLVQGARIPRPEQLPEDLRELAYRNSVELTHARWESDVELLIKALQPHVGAPAESAWTPPPLDTKRLKRWWHKAAVAAGLVVLLISGSVLVSDKSGRPPEIMAEAEKPAPDPKESVAAVAKVDPAPEKNAAEPIAEDKPEPARKVARAEPERYKVTTEQTAAEPIAEDKPEPARKVARAEPEKYKVTTERIARERTVDSTPQIAGLWRDEGYPNNGSQVTQDGNNFRFTHWGVLPNGVRFESSGSGTISGQRYTSRYNARYQSGDTSWGNCSGVVSSDARRIETSCTDSLLGGFSVAGVRQ